MTNGLLNESSYMVKYLRIPSYIRKPFLIYDCNCSTLNFLIYEENLIFFLSMYGMLPVSPDMWEVGLPGELVGPQMGQKNGVLTSDPVLK
jgi:hypothetical protein